MTYHGFPMQRCLPLNAFNSIRIGSTVCTKLAQVLQNPSFLIFHLGEGLVLMAVTQHVDKSCPFRIDDRFLAWLGGPKPGKFFFDPKPILQDSTMCIVLTTCLYNH
jgi:hypothetical protein